MSKEGQSALLVYKDNSPGHIVSSRCLLGVSSSSTSALATQRRSSPPTHSPNTWASREPAYGCPWRGADAIRSTLLYAWNSADGPTVGGETEREAECSLTLELATHVTCIHAKGLHIPQHNPGGLPSTYHKLWRPCLRGDPDPETADSGLAPQGRCFCCNAGRIPWDRQQAWERG